VRKHYDVESRPDELGDKTRLLGHFSTYLMQKLYGEHDYAFIDHQRTSGMDFVQKYLRLKHAILFKLSNDVLQVSLSFGRTHLSSDILQFNFYDHSKLILSHRGHVVALITKEDVLQRYFLAEILVSPSIVEDKDLREKLLTKLKYCRQVLREIRKGEVVLVKPVTSASTPGTNLESAGSSTKDQKDGATSALRFEDIGRKAVQTTSSKLMGTQIR
jgi:cell cycle serine/threonine-protein kinase CDC5/MSD2